MDKLRLDEIGRWSEIKLEIIREYAKPYSQILANQPKFYHIYLDGFAGAGMHLSKSTGQRIAGSPLNVTSVVPPFREYHLVELNARKSAHLRKLFSKDTSVHVHDGDCNVVVPKLISEHVRYEDYRRAFCLLDPYGLHLEWNVIATAGSSKTIDLLLNFPTMDMNMNVLWNKATEVSADQAGRMTRFWGDDSWKNAAYRDEPNLFGQDQVKTDNETVVRAFTERLKKVAGFKYVAQPLPMKNQINRTVYYLVFASQNSTAHKIIGDIFAKRRKQMGV